MLRPSGDQVGLGIDRGIGRELAQHLRREIERVDVEVALHRATA